MKSNTDLNLNYGDFRYLLQNDPIFNINQLQTSGDLQELTRHEYSNMVRSDFGRLDPNSDILSSDGLSPSN